MLVFKVLKRSCCITPKKSSKTKILRKFRAAIASLMKLKQIYNSQ